ncbi:hypothetical protein GCM10009765_73040 [Fodinicola feengrottensis]|uniref:Phosphatidic acid phosphatase type 2/haloperoxidase domain-containing protein n=1 Tax=Fodinicola feengrottensis TaxID=435914 RepID=A0ABN2IWS1_9ACTN
MGPDSTLFLQINQFAAATPWVHGFMAAYALWGGLVGLVLVLGCCWWRVRRERDGYRSMAGVLATGLSGVVALAVSSYLLGPLINRPRPFVAMPHVLQLLPHAADSSFPSDHAMVAGALAAGILLIHRRLGLVAVVFACLLAFARVYVGVHYPSDVISGLLIGFAVTAALMIPLVAALAPLLVRLARTPLRPLLVAGVVRDE